MSGEVLQVDYKPLSIFRKHLQRSSQYSRRFSEFFYLFGGPYVGRELTAAKTYRIKFILKVWCFLQHLEGEDLQSIYKIRLDIKITN